MDSMEALITRKLSALKQWSNISILATGIDNSPKPPYFMPVAPLIQARMRIGVFVVKHQRHDNSAIGGRGSPLRLA
jgi:hypothetical protein